MIYFEGTFVRVSQGFFTGWKVLDKMTGTIAVPNWLLKERIGLTWMQVRQTKKGKSIDSKLSEDAMFMSFARAVLDPSGNEGELWKVTSPDDLADNFIAYSNERVTAIDEMFKSAGRP
jgi:hypothetical protein